MAKSEEKGDKRMNGGLVGSLNIIEFDGTNCDGKIEAVVTGNDLIRKIRRLLH